MKQQEPSTHTLLPPPPASLLEYATQRTVKAHTHAPAGSLIHTAEAEAFEAWVKERNPQMRWKRYDRWVELRMLLTEHES